MFIGGVGRSGTSVVREVLSTNDEVIAFPFEYRFIIDPDGIIDFINSNNNNWSPYNYEKKILRLNCFLKRIGKRNLLDHSFGKVLRLVRITRNNISANPYHGWELSKYFPNYFYHVDELIANLIDFNYKGFWVGTESYKYKNKVIYSNHRNREELINICSQFLNNLFSDLFFKENKNILVEDNTWNLLFIDTLSELFKSSKFIHIYRDPRDIISSYTKQRWMPNDVKKSAVICRDLYNSIFEKTSSFSDKEFLSISLEDLIYNKNEKLKIIANFIGIEVSEKMKNFNLHAKSIDRYKKDISSEKIVLIEPIIRKTVEKLGYTW